MSYLRHRTADPKWLILAFIMVSFFGWFINSVPPAGFTHITIFFLFVGAILYPVLFFLFNNVRRTILTILGVLLFLLTRMLGLREMYYPLLLLILFVSLEVYIIKSSRKY